MEIQNLVSVATLGQLSLLLIVLAMKRPFTRTHLIALAFFVSVAGYLFVSNPILDTLLGPTRPLFLLLAFMPPYLLWLFAIEVFEIDSLQHRLFNLILLLPPTVFFLQWTPLAEFGQMLHRLSSLVLLAHLLVTILVDHRNDLLQPRRRFRIGFVALIAIETCAILIVESVYADTAVPDSLETINAGAIALLVMFLGIPLITAENGIFEKNYQAHPTSSSPSRRQKKELQTGKATVQEALITELNELMEAGFFTTSGLSIKQLADELNTTEHFLRATINQQMHYRNFNAFLNSYRIAAAKERLGDPRFAQTPILTIALELGYQSIGPFNRAFKATTGMTPSDFRQSKH